jgi:calcineurin-like phosphoesterase family protein
MSEIFVTSDTHFFHKNILKYQPNERPFEDVYEMNRELIKRWNEVVSPEDEIWHLGDFAFAGKKKVLDILSQLNGKKYYIFGNHDGVMNSPEVKEHFKWMGKYKRVNWCGRSVVLFHYPIHVWDKMAHGSYHLYGHTHCQIPHLYHGRSMDVGVDGNDCYPWNVKDIFELFDKAAIAEDENIDPRGRGEIR